MTTAAWALRTFPPPRRTFPLRLVSLLVADAMAVFLAGAAAVLARYAFGGHFDPRLYLHISGATAAFLVAYAAAGLYPAVIVHPVAELERIFRATTLTVLGLATVSFFAREVEAYS